MSNSKRAFSQADLDVKRGVELISKTFEDRLAAIECENKEIREVLELKHNKIEELLFILNQLKTENSQLKDEINELKQERKKYTVKMDNEHDCIKTRDNRSSTSHLNNFQDSEAKHNLGFVKTNMDNTIRDNLPYSSRLNSGNVSRCCGSSPNFSELMASSNNTFSYSSSHRKNYSVDQFSNNNNNSKDRSTSISVHTTCETKLGRFEHKISLFRSKLKQMQQPSIAEDGNVNNFRNSTSNNKFPKFIHPHKPEKDIKIRNDTEILSGKSNYYIMVSRFFSECRIVLPSQKFEEILSLMNPKETKILDRDSISRINEILNPYPNILSTFELILTYIDN